jgi:hypothetical protein
MTHISRMASISAALLLSTAAFAATADFAKIDANADGKITLEEGMKLHPDWTADAFMILDKDGDGMLSQTEYETPANAPAASTNATGSTTENTNAVPDASNTTDSTSKTNAAPAPDDTIASTTAVTTENNVTVATKRTLGPASYVDQVGENDMLASKLIGMSVYAVESDVDDTKTYPADSRKDWAAVGEVNDVVLNWDGSIKAVVLGVGGFLGIGEKNVAIDMTSLGKVRESADSNDWFLVVNSSKQALTDAPPYGTNNKS